MARRLRHEWARHNSVISTAAADIAVILSEAR
jgi:hypothetical protein